MQTGLAIAWIVAIVSFAAVQTTLRKVVRPIEELSGAADRIAAGDLTATAPVAGDREIATLGVAFNRMADELKARARTDDLTALPNFRAFRERIDAEIERADRYPAPFGVLVLDLDRFKKYNDTFGHLAGNDALRRVAQSMRETIRAVDFAARYGGEEFAVVLPQVDAQSLAAIAERVRANIEALPAPPDGAQLTVSIGSAMYPRDGRDREALFKPRTRGCTRRRNSDAIAWSPPRRSASRFQLRDELLAVRVKACTSRSPISRPRDSSHWS
jgi:diguanylate cyclase (GGDEF)-like protein